MGSDEFAAVGISPSECVKFLSAYLSALSVGRERSMCRSCLRDASLLKRTVTADVQVSDVLV